MWSGIADTCRIGGCSIISMLVVLYASGRDASRRASNSPSASSTSGSTARPTPTPTRCAPPVRDERPEAPEGHQLAQPDASDPAGAAPALRDHAGGPSHVVGEPAEVQQGDGAAPD